MSKAAESRMVRAMAGGMFERYGFIRVARIVMTFYDRVLESERLRTYFAETDMRRIIDHQTKFLSSVMEGPVSYTPAELTEVHAGWAIDEATFEETIVLLESALRECEVSEDDLQMVIASVRERQPYIVQRTSR